MNAARNRYLLARPLDALSTLCLKSQVTAGHKVTVYSFEPLAQLPEGVGNAEAKASSARFRREAAPDRPRRGVARLDHLAVQRFLPDAADGAEPACGSTPTLLLKPVEIDPTTLFAWERPRQLGNSVLYLPSGIHRRRHLSGPLMQQDELSGLAGAAAPPDVRPAQTARLTSALGYRVAITVPRR